MADQAASMEASVTVSELSDLLNKSGVSARQAADKAEELGIHLPYGTIAGYWAGNHPEQPREPTLQALSEVTRVPLRRLRRSIGVQEGESQPWSPPAESSRLTRQQRKALDQLIKSIVSAGEEPQQREADLPRGPQINPDAPTV